jgi:hypothetical protein
MHPRLQAPGNPSREGREFSKNGRESAIQIAYYHGVVGMQDLFLR